MPNGEIGSIQATVLSVVLKDRVVTDLGAGDCILAHDLLRLGAASVICVDRKRPDFATKRKFRIVESTFQDYVPKEPIDIAFVSWPTQTEDAGLLRLVESAKLVVYLGSNTDGNACGSQSLFEHFSRRLLRGAVPWEKNTLLIFGDHISVDRPLTGEEYAARYRSRIMSYADAEEVTLRNFSAAYEESKDAVYGPIVHVAWSHVAKAPGSCPYCCARIEMASRIGNEEEVPKPGDICFCIECGEPMAITETYGYRKLSMQEQADAAIENEEYLAYHAALSKRTKS